MVSNSIAIRRLSHAHSIRMHAYWVKTPPRIYSEGDIRAVIVFARFVMHCCAQVKSTVSLR
jgi:hypothetical protein